MKTIIVDLQEGKLTPSLIDYLKPVTIVDDTRVVLVRSIATYPSPDATIRCELGFETTSSPFGSGKTITGRQDICFWSMDKIGQAPIIEMFGKGIEGFKSVVSCPKHFVNSTTFPSGRVIIKPSSGARSLGQVVFDSNEHTASDIWYLIDKHTRSDELLECFKENDYKAYYSHGHEREREEGYKQLRQAGIFQEFVEGITHEFRIITGAENTPVISINRKLKSVSGDRSIPDVSSDKVTTDALETMFPKVHNGLLEFLSKVDMPFHSIDVFVTEDGHWGIFEFSPEFCNREYGPNILSHEAVKFLRKYLLEG